MKFEAERIHFLSDVLICCHPEILLPWQRDVTTNPLYQSIDLWKPTSQGSKSKGCGHLLGPDQNGCPELVV